MDANIIARPPLDANKLMAFAHPQCSRIDPEQLQQPLGKFSIGQSAKSQRHAPTARVNDESQ